MRALHVTPYFAPAFVYGGPPRSILGLCQGLQRAGVEVDVLTTAANGAEDLPASLLHTGEYAGVPVTYAPSAFPRRFFGARLRRLIDERLGPADLCHVHGVWNVPEWMATRRSRASGVPYVLSPRGMLHSGALQRGRWRKRVAYPLIERSALSGASLLHATSEEEASVLHALGLGVPIVMLPNAVDTSAIERASVGGARRQLGLGARDRVIAFLGRMHPIKRLDLLAEAFARVHQRYADARLVLAGPDEHNHLATISRRLAPHAGAVRVAGRLDEERKWSLLKDADLLVLCSDSESFGLVVVEAMAAGLPVVVTRTCPWADIEIYRCGWWVEQTAAAIADAVLRLIEDPTEARAMGARGARLARERYSWPAVGASMADHYRRLVATGDPGAA